MSPNPAQPEPSRLIRRGLLALVVLVSMLLPWFSASDHALYSPDEGRYASVAQRMVDSGHWLVPEYRGEAHLTKPPLTYWLIGASIKALGPTTIAVRLPMLVAGSLCVLIVFLIGMSWRGPTVGAIAAGTLGVMPLFELVSRYAVTDSLLNLCWTGALGAGWMATRRPSIRWAALFWFAVAMGLMAKGPAALIPALILLIWLLICRDWAGLRRLRIWAGLPLCVLPVVAWGLAVLATHEDAMAIWRHEVVDRAVGTGEHTQPIWFFAPVFLAGMFPATAMLVVPGFNITWKRAWTNLRTGETSALWVIAVAVNVLVFTLIAGKLPSYILPSCAPIALLTADMLWRRARRVDESGVPGFKRAPDVVVTLAITCGVVGVGGYIAASSIDQLSHSAVTALGLLVVGSVAAMVVWVRWPDRRPAAMLLAWAGGVAVWGLFFEAEDRYAAIASPVLLAERLEAFNGGPVARVDVLGFHDPALDFYLRGVARYVSPFGFIEAESGPDRAGLVLADEPKWRKIEAEDPAFASRYETLGVWQRRWTHPTLILRIQQGTSRTGGGTPTTNTE